MTDDFDEDEEEAWAVYNSFGPYAGIFLTGVALAALLSYLAASV
ncbi:hypothetical protein LJR231_004285 [Phyllobacterium sp. LjRoot231]